MEKSKRIGRRHYTAKARQEFVALFERSGLTQTEFARQHELKLCTFHQWLQRAKEPTKAPGGGFKEVFLPEGFPPVAPAVEIAIGTEITLRLRGPVSPDFIGQIVQQVRRVC